MAWTLASATRPVTQVTSKALAMIPALPWYGWAGIAVGAAAILLSARAAGATEAPGGPGRPDGLAPLLKKGDAGPWVAYLQVRLGISPTGTFDEETDAAVRAFQGANGLTVDGLVGAGTWTALGVDPIHNAPPAPGPGPGPGPGPTPQPQPAPPGPAPTPTVGNPFGLSETIATRDGQILSIVGAGNYEHQWVPLDYVADGHQIHLLVSRRALALNDGSNRLMVSMTYKGQQKLADMIGGAMMTTRIADEIAKKAIAGAATLVMNTKNVPVSQNWVADGTMSKTTRMYEQSNYVDKRVADLGGGPSSPGNQKLVANEGKDWVITRHFWMPPQGLGPTSAGKSLHNSANFGWYYNPPMGSSKSPGGMSIVQSVGMVHDMNHADYSQNQRFVKPDSLTIDGQSWDWGSALADPSVSKYIQDEGGTIPSPRHPDL